MTTSAPTVAAKDPKVWMLGGVLALALVGVVLSWQFSRKADRAPAESAPATILVSELTTQADQLAKSVQSRLLADADAIDVSWPAAVVPAPAARPRAAQAEQMFRLRGVARDGARPVAFLDDFTVGLGEEVQGYKLVEIADESVTLVDERGRKHVVQLYNGQ